MQILLVAATAMEISPILAQRPAIDYLITGVGSPFSIYQITRRIHQIDYDLVIQAGIAGSFDRSLQLGEVVVVTSDTFADLGISEKNKFYSIFEKGFSDAGSAPFNNGWLKNNPELTGRLSLKEVRAITVNTVTDDESMISSLVSKFAPQIETMEGAALHYVCLLEHIPFIQLRSVSNYVGERDHSKWKINEAVHNLNTELLELYKKLAG